jgi:hypothetical protein
MKAVENDSNIEVEKTTIPQTGTMARGQPHTRVLENMPLIQSDDSDYVDSNRSDVDDDCTSENEDQSNVPSHNWQEKFPMLQEWTPQADKLAKKRKTMASMANLTRPPGAGRKQSKRKETTKVTAQDRVLEFPGQSFYAHGGELRCRACSCSISRKMSTVKCHSLCKSHLVALEKLSVVVKKRDSIINVTTAKKPDCGFGSKTSINTDTYRMEICYKKDYPLPNSLPTYKTIAEIETQNPQPKNLWIFWVANMLNLHHWYLGAEYIALIQPSSGCSERIFALLISMFGDTQQAALEDRREASVMIRANENFRESEKKQLEE